MAVISSLLVRLGLNSADFASGSKKAVKDFSSLKAGLAAGVSAAVATSAISTIQNVGQRAFATMAETIDRVDNLGDFADRIGVSAGQLSALQYAAKKTDVDVGALNTSLQKFVVTLGKATAGNQIGKTFQSLGLDSQALKGIDAVAAMQQTFAKIRQLSTVSEQGAIAQALFGKSGPQILSLIRVGKDDLAAMVAEGRRFGAVLSDIDVSRMSMMADQIKIAEARMEGLKNQATLYAGAVANSWSGVIEKMLSGANNGIPKHLVTDSFASALWDTVINGNLQAASATSGLKSEMEAAAESAEQQAAAMGKVSEAGKLLQTMQNELAFFGQEGRNRQISQAGLTATDAEWNRLIALNEQLSTMEQMEALRQRAAELTKVDLTAVEEHKKRLEEIASLENKRLIDHRQADDLQAQARADLARRQEAELIAERSAPLQKQLEAMQARRDLLNFDSELQGTDGGPQRAAALERGSSSAFSASFGSKPIDKHTAEMLKVNREILTIQRQLLVIEKDTGDKLGK